jgi:hypothetical protein
MAAVTSLGNSFSTASGTHTVTATPAVGDIIIIITASTGNTSAATPTDDNSSGVYVEIGSGAVMNASGDTMRAFARTTPIPAAVSTVFTHAPGTSTGGGLLVLKATGMTRFGALAAAQSLAVQNNQGAATPAPVLGGTPQSANPVVTAVFNNTNTAGLTKRTGYTDRTGAAGVGYTLPTTGFECCTIDSAESSATITWGSASASAFCSLALELDTKPVCLPLAGEGALGGMRLAGSGGLAS